MRRKLVIVNLVLVICSTGMPLEALSQSKPYFGLSLYHGFSAFSNNNKVVSDEVAGYINPPSDIRPDGLWQTGSVMVDSYWKQKKVIVSFGLSSFRYKSVSDSALPIVGTYPHYGQLTETSTVILPTFHLGYRIKMKDRLYYKPSISFGITKLISRYKTNGVAYDSSSQPAWDKHNQIYGGGLVTDFEKNAITMELDHTIVYDLQRWSLSCGLSYFYYRNLPIKGYHGLHFNIGCSVLLGNIDE